MLMSGSFARSHPGIEARTIPGFRHIDLMKRDLGEEVEFQTLMWFDSLDAIKAFVGEDYEVSHVPAGARAVLERFDDRAAHYRSHRPPRTIAAKPLACPSAD